MRSSSPTTMPSIERVVDECSSISISGGIGPVGRLAVDVVHRVVVEQLDDAVERRLRRRSGSCSGATPAPNFVLELVERAGERRPLAVELVHEDRAREPELLGHAPHDLGLHLDAFDRGDHEHREVGGTQRGGDVAHEVGVAGRVDHVDLVAVVLERRQRERHRDAAARLFGVEVGGGAAVLDLSRGGGSPRR